MAIVARTKPPRIRATVSDLKTTENIERFTSGLAEIILLIQNGTLKEKPNLLALCDKKITDDAICFLAPEIAQLLKVGIEVIDLSQNMIGGKGLSALADYLLSDPKLKKIDLSLNTIDDDVFELFLRKAMQRTEPLEIVVSYSISQRLINLVTGSKVKINPLSTPRVTPSTTAVIVALQSTAAAPASNSTKVEGAVKSKPDFQLEEDFFNKDRTYTLETCAEFGKSDAPKSKEEPKQFKRIEVDEKFRVRVVTHSEIEDKHEDGEAPHHALGDEAFEVVDEVEQLSNSDNNGRVSPTLGARS